MIAWPNESSVCQWSGRTGFNPRSIHAKNSKKWYLMPPCLALRTIRWGSRVKWSIPGNGVAPSLLHRGVVAIEKGAFGSPTTTVANLSLDLRGIPYANDILLEEHQWYNTTYIKRLIPFQRVLVRNWIL